MFVSVEKEPVTIQINLIMAQAMVVSVDIMEDAILEMVQIKVRLEAVEVAVLPILVLKKQC